MFKRSLLCLTLCAALEAQPHLPKRGAAESSQATVQKLVNDLTAATADKNLSSREIAQLTSDFNKVLNSAGISASELNAVISDTQTILKVSGVSSADAAAMATDLKEIGAEAQKTAQPGDIRKKFGRK